jgi:hypothetical protein
VGQAGLDLSCGNAGLGPLEFSASRTTRASIPRADAVQRSRFQSISAPNFCSYTAGDPTLRFHQFAKRRASIARCNSAIRNIVAKRRSGRATRKLDNATCDRTTAPPSRIPGGIA